MTMKVAFVSYLYPPASVLGGAKMAYELTREIENEGVEVKRITQYTAHSNNFPHFAWKARRMVGDCDIVHGNTLGEIFITDKPCVTFINHPERHNRDRIPRSLIYRYVEGVCFRKSRVVTTPSKLVKDELAGIYGQPEKIEIIYSGVNEVSGLQEGEAKTILCTTGTGKRKGIEYLIEAVGLLAKKHPDIKLRITGTSAEYTARMRPRLEKLGICDKVMPLGFISEEKVDEEYRKAGLVVVPSLYEGFGLPIIEGMAYRKPVITTPVGIAPEIVEDGRNALLAKAGDPYSIAEAIDRVISDDALRRSIAYAGHETSRRFTWKNSAKKAIDVYNRVLEAF